jgi:ATPase subunit of ABC transporter with duplicated ATPase domains
MSSSIVLAGAGWVAPDGTSILSDVSLRFTAERTGLVGRNGVGKTTLLKLITGELRPTSGDVAVNGTITALRQRVQVSRDQTIADLLGIADGLAAIRKGEAGTATLDELAHADWTLETRAAEALARVGLAAPLETPLIELSGGQRTRASLAGAIFAAPDFLLLDEPTNDLDRDGREAVHDFLQSWRSGAIVVSQDRELLELTDSIVELSSLGAARYGGNWSAYAARKEIERAAAEQDLASATRQVEQIARKRQVALERKQRRDKTASRKAARGDMPRILAAALRTAQKKAAARRPGSPNGCGTMPSRPPSRRALGSNGVRRCR